MLAQDKHYNLLIQRLKRSPTAAELAAQVNKTEAELTQIKKLTYHHCFQLIRLPVLIIFFAIAYAYWDNPKLLIFLLTYMLHLSPFLKKKFFSLYFQTTLLGFEKDAL